MIRLEMKSCNSKSLEKQQKYQHYHQVKLVNIYLLQTNKYYFQVKSSTTAS